MEGQLGILVGGRTELALFTAINSLPLTAYRFLLPKSLASCSSFSILLVIPYAHFVLLFVVRFYYCGYSKQSRCFLSQARSTPQERGPWLAETALSRKWWESMRSVCLSASRNARTHTRAHTLNRSLCSWEFEMQNGNASGRAGRLPRGIFCGRDVPVRFAVGSGIGVAR